MLITSGDVLISPTMTEMHPSRNSHPVKTSQFDSSSVYTANTDLKHILYLTQCLQVEFCSYLMKWPFCYKEHPLQLFSCISIPEVPR